MSRTNHELLEQMMCKELDMLVNKYETSKAEMSVEDLKKIDMLYHALKSKATYDAMTGRPEYEYEQSGRRMYNHMSGHYEEPYYPGYSPRRW